MKWQCVLALIGLFAGVVNSWDIAVTMGDQLEFYANQTKTQSETNTRFGDLRALAYDAVHNMLLFVDKESDNASIFSYHLNNKKLQSLVKKKSRENIQGLAFDPVEGKLFWTDFLHKSIFWTSLRPGAENSVSGNLLLSLPDQYPRAIAVDSCRGYIYWTNADPGKSTIERARLDGSDRKVILNSSSLYTAVSIAVDQRTRRIYWADDKEGSKCSIESADLDGNDRQFVINDIEHIPNSLAVSKDYIYWTDSSWQVIWKVSKDPTRDQIPEKVVTYDRFDQIPIGVAANYAIDDQTKGIAECETLRRLTEYKPAINESFNIPNEASFLCYNGTLEGASCKCNIGFAGEHCEVSLCHNYCFKGICSVTSKGLPVCRCTNGFTGERCENNLCNGHCLNKGTCSMKRDGTPSCQCTEDYRGDRCETIRENNVLVPVKSKETENCNCTSALRSVDGEFVETSDSWDAVRDPIIMVLGVATGLLCLACVVLITKIMQLKKRPRIKKRIIVNKNVTPLTARPDQCEITIENCCNMNICETPCFEPRGTIRPTLRDAKPGKEEKSNLIANMEYPDDY